LAPVSAEPLGDIAAMAIHWVRIIESGHMSTQRLFQLGMSFGVCKRKHRWPSLETINSFLKGGVDDGERGTDIEWEPCQLSKEEYEQSIKAVMDGEPFELDTDPIEWDVWFAKLKGGYVA
jgi:hypothetical protein